MRLLVIACLSVFCSHASASDPKSFIFGDAPEFRELTKTAESSAWAWCSATAGFSVDLLVGESRLSPVITALTRMSEASENAIFSLHWWEYEMQLYRKRDTLRHTAGTHKDRVEEFRELAKEMVRERRHRILQASRSISEDRDLLKHQIRKTLTLCEGNVEGMEYYSQLWNGWMAANRAKLNF